MVRRFFRALGIVATLACAVPLAAHAQEAPDSLEAVLRDLPGYTPTSYGADSAEYTADPGLMHLRGNAKVAREGRKLTAGVITLDHEAGWARATEDPKVVGEQSLKGHSLAYNLKTGRTTVEGAKMQIKQGATWYVQGDATVDSPSRLYLEHTTFTTCDLEEPHYHFQSDQVLIIRDSIFVARPARLYVGNVPILTLPFAVRDIRTGRRSGILQPRLSLMDIVRTSSSYRRQISNVGAYWAINDYMGAKTWLDWRSGEYTTLSGQFDFRNRKHFLNGSVTYRSFWPEGGGRQTTLGGNLGWQPDERSDIRLAGRYASSSRYVRQTSTDVEEVLRDLTSNGSISRRFEWGSLHLGASRAQSIMTGEVRTTLPTVSISPRTLTFWPAPEGQSRWYNNASLTWSARGQKTMTHPGDSSDLEPTSQSTAGINQSLSLGNLSLSSDAQLRDSDRRGREEQTLETAMRLSYRQSLIGSTALSPMLSLSRSAVRDTVAGRPWVGGVPRVSFGASLSTDLYGFFPGLGGYSAFRHRISPRASYAWAPEVEQSTLQERVFGARGGAEQSRVTFSFNQTIEGKVRLPEEEPRSRAPQTDSVQTDSVQADSVQADSVQADSAQVETRQRRMPRRAPKKTLLSLNTSPLQYDFVQARETGNGWVTDRLSNSISSDLIPGLRISTQHRLFEKDAEDPNERRFRPHLSTLNASASIGSGVLGWAGTRLGLVPEANEPRAGRRRAGGGGFRASLDYTLQRPTPRMREMGDATDRETIRLSSSFSLTPKWQTRWNTSYSITDDEFAYHRISFVRDLHRWEAHFDFSMTPSGNAEFSFRISNRDVPELELDYREEFSSGGR